jgi:hypothetical protein
MVVMKKIKRLFLVILLTFHIGVSFSQTADSLHVFPNPFSDSTTIYFDLAQPDTITLRLFNLTGQIVQVFYQETLLPIGSYTINLLGDGLSNGVYLVRLDIGSTKNITKKVVKDSSVIGLSDTKTDDKLNIFPNPTSEFVTIPIVGNKAIVISDFNGKVIKSFKTDQQIISFLDIAIGQYLITVSMEQNEKIITQRIIKIQ